MRKAETKDRLLVTEILAEAFDQNKSVNFVVRQDSKRMSRIRRLMGYSFDYCVEFGEVLISDDNHACALILYPDRKRTSLKSILWDCKLALTVVGLSRVNAILSRESQIKQNHPHTPFMHLWFVGVKRQFQGKGIGRALMNEIIELSNQSQRPIYLETSV